MKLSPPARSKLRTGMLAGYAASLSPAWLRFMAAASDPERAQLSRLRKILRANEETAFGRAVGLGRVDSLRSFRRRVPVAGYEAHAPWIERVAAGEPGVLTMEPVRMMEPTSGSTAEGKLIPFTSGFLDEIAAATHPWLFDLHRNCRGLWGTRSYWSISPATRARTTTPGGIPIGIEDDTEYFGPLARWVLGELMAVPGHVGWIEDVDEWRKETCLRLLAAEDLGLISVWSPTFILRLMESIEGDLDSLLARLDERRAAGIRRAIDERGGKLDAGCLWPRLALVSCWADGPSRAFLPALSRYFPATPLQPKGLLATEGVVTFPLWGHEGAVAAVAGHFLEFLDLEHPSRPPLLAHEVREDSQVSPILTTSGGLYRYHLRDRLRCVARYRNAPCLRFEGRLDSVSDLVGEKLDEAVVGLAIATATRAAGVSLSFAMLAPEMSDPPFYHLFVEGLIAPETAETLASKVDSVLREGAHYDYCRRMGQLGPVRAVKIEGGIETMERRRVAEGGVIGQMKPGPLDRRCGWSGLFRSVACAPSCGGSPRMGPLRRQ